MTTQDWYLNELIHAGDEHLATNYVETYDEKADFDPAIDLKPLVASGLNEAHTLIDFGAGTGTFALAAAQVCKHVIAVDVSPAMVQRLHEKIRQQGITNVTAVQAGFLSYQHQGEPVDFVYSRHALHHLADFWKVIALNRIVDVMKSGGVFYLRDLVYACEPGAIESVLETWLAHAPTTPDAGWTRAELVTHIQDEHSSFSWLLESMLERAGFAITAIDHAETRVHSAYTCVKQ